MAFRLLPREEKFYTDFLALADELKRGARLLEEMLAPERPVWDKADEIKEVEHKCDFLTHEIIQRLNRTFVTPIDRDDISNLASSMDDVIDWIEEVGRRIHLYRVDEPTLIARQFSRVILEQAEQIARAVPLLESRRYGDPLQRAIEEIHRLENEADDLLAQAIANLYDGVTEVPQLIKAMRWNDLYQLLEDTTDKCENVATVLSNIALKNA